jgi:hypothetical protein
MHSYAFRSNELKRCFVIRPRLLAGRLLGTPDQRQRLRLETTELMQHRKVDGRAFSHAAGCSQRGFCFPIEVGKAGFA